MADETPMEEEGAPENVSNADSFDLPMKKKKKKKKKIPHSSPYKLAEEFSRSFPNEDGDDDDEEERGFEGDYGYEKLLGRVFNNLRKHNPDIAGDKRRTVLRPPEVLHDGTMKTIFVNFIDLCRTMHRDPDHFVSFLRSQTGTSASLDEQDLLIVKGRFSSKSIEVVLQKYIACASTLMNRYTDKYVLCDTCKSPDTVLSHEGCLISLGCEQCGSERRLSCR